jgi:hypothetical protein
VRLKKAQVGKALAIRDRRGDCLHAHIVPVEYRRGIGHGGDGLGVRIRLHLSGCAGDGQVLFMEISRNGFFFEKKKMTSSFPFLDARLQKWISFFGLQQNRNAWR